MIYQLSPTERKELKDISKKYTRYQLNSRERISVLVAKKSGGAATTADAAELSKLQKFVNEHGTDIDKFHKLSEKAARKFGRESP